MSVIDFAILTTLFCLLAGVLALVLIHVYVLGQELDDLRTQTVRALTDLRTQTARELDELRKETALTLTECYVRQACDRQARQLNEADFEYRLGLFWQAHNALLQAHNDWAAWHRSQIGVNDDTYFPGEGWRRGVPPDEEVSPSD